MCIEKRNLKSPESVEALQDRVLSAFHRYILSGPHHSHVTSAGQGAAAPSLSIGDPTSLGISYKMESPSNGNDKSNRKKHSLCSADEKEVSSTPSERASGTSTIGCCVDGEEVGVGDNGVAPECESGCGSEAGVGTGPEAGVGSKRWAKMVMKLLSLRAITQRHADALLSLKLTPGLSLISNPDLDAQQHALLRCPCADRVATTTQLLLELFF